MIRGISFADPEFFLLLLLLPAMVYWYWKKYNRSFPSFTVSGVQNNPDIRKSARVKLIGLPVILRIAAFTFLVIAIARPQSSLKGEEINSEGIDIVLSLDISGSMLARDFNPDRLEAAKQVAKEFIEGRPSDRIGLVIFSGESFTQCPITTDHAVLLNLFKDIHSGMVEDGTAIGMGLATAVARLNESTAKSKVVILMTDGVNNTGYVDPFTAIELAKSQGVRVYTIGIGTRGKAMYPFKDEFGRTFYQKMDVQIDEALLSKIAKETGGEYFRATNNSKLRAIYQEIDQLEKSKIKVNAYSRKSEEFFPWAWLGLALLLLEFLLRNTFLKSIA